MAELTVIRVFNDGSTTADSVASIDVPEDGDIVGIHGNLAAAGMDAAGDSVEVELSFLSTNQLGTNDARGSLMALDVRNTVATVAAITNDSLSTFIGIPDGIPVNAGERIHLHRIVSTGASARARFDIYFKTSKVTRRTRRRR